MNSRTEYVLIPFLLVDGVLVFGLVILWQLDWIVNNTLYSYNLVFSFDWAVPYWTFWRIAAGSFLLAVVTITLLGYVSYRQVKRRNMMPTYICKGCGSAWTMAFAGAKVERAGGSRRLRFLKSCPRCNQTLLAD